jgi:hypothetical protein
MSKDGPMLCEHPDCAAFRAMDGSFANRLQEAGVIAHYQGYSALYGEPIWMLGGITPITRKSLESLIRKQT